jgi:hypothetical protein
LIFRGPLQTITMQDARTVPERMSELCYLQSLPGLKILAAHGHSRHLPDWRTTCLLVIRKNMVSGNDTETACRMACWHVLPSAYRFERFPGLDAARHSFYPQNPFADLYMSQMRTYRTGGRAESQRASSQNAARFRHGAHRVPKIPPGEVVLRSRRNG